MAQVFVGPKALAALLQKRYLINMKKQNICVAMIFAAACLVTGQAAFAQKNLGQAVRRLANSQTERAALSDMFKASKTLKESVKKAASVELEPAAFSASKKVDFEKYSSKAAAFSALSEKDTKLISSAVDRARDTALLSYTVDTRVFLTDGFRAHFSSNKGNPVVFVNISRASSVGVLELFDKLGKDMINRRMYIQTEEGGLVALFENYEPELNTHMEQIMRGFAASGKYNFVQAVNLKTKQMYMFSSKGNTSYHAMSDKDFQELSRLLGRDTQPGRFFRPLTPAAKTNAIRFMQHHVLANDPSAAMVVIAERDIQKLAAQFPVRQAVLVKITTPFATQELTNAIWNRFGGENLSWEQEVFFENGDFGDDILLQTAVPELRQILKYDYRMIVHTSR